MMRQEPNKYWSSDENQRAYREALTLAHGVGSEAPGELSSTSANEVRGTLGVAPPAATPATPAPALGPAAPAALPGPAAEPARVTIAPTATHT